ncbi:MAG: 4Fe-4S binding protein [Firmicutes bacterium]|jgi:NAD-dependent dihydropyrimidine dehydrogenase PreA subunit|nr:4Fe-4S binding protein [Bacillota bacterium]
MKYGYLRNVVTLHLSAERCIGCGRCAEVCPHRVFSMNEEKAQVDDRDRCMECGACAKNCPANAITVKAGVGCAAAVMKSWFTRSKPDYDCSCAEGCC